MSALLWPNLCSMISVLFGGQSAIQQCVSDVVAIANEPRDHEQAKARIKELLDKVGQSFSVAQKLRDQLRVVCNVSRPLRQAVLRRADRVTGGETSQGLITVGPPVHADHAWGSSPPITAPSRSGSAMVWRIDAGHDRATTPPYRFPHTDGPRLVGRSAA
jgi:hypothetical protein